MTDENMNAEKNTDNVPESSEKVISSGLFNRMFAWKKISAQNENSMAKLNAKIDELETSCSSTNDELSRIKTNLKTAEDKNRDLLSKIDNLELKLGRVEDTAKTKTELLEKTQAELNDVSEKLTDVSGQLTSLQIEKATNDTNILNSWNKHSITISEKLNEYARKYKYIKISTDDYQYAGSPENVFQFGREYTIIDTISPKSFEEVKAFPARVKGYAEEMKKYYKVNVVRADTYLVVPTSAASFLDTSIYYFPSYTVHVVTPEALLPILNMLHTLETYDFANQLAEEGRSSICKLLAKLSLTAKKKIQLDTIYSKDLIATLKEIKTLPIQYTNEIASYEERTKLLEIESLSSNVDKVEEDFVGYTEETEKDE